MVWSIFQIERALSDKMSDEFAEDQQGFNVKVDPEPQDSYSNVSRIDLENNTLYIKDNEFEDIQSQVELWTDIIAEEAIKEKFYQIQESLGEDLGIETEKIEDVCLVELPGAIFGRYDFQSEVLLVDIDRKHQITPTSENLRASKQLKGELAHEASHALQFSESEYLSLIYEIRKDVDDWRPYKDIVNHAGIESLAVLNEDPLGTTKLPHRIIDDYIGNPWHIPTLLSISRNDNRSENNPRINGGNGFELLEESIYSCPYEMADVIGFTVKNFFQEQEAVNEIKQTRRVLYGIKADAKQWEEILSSIWEDTGIPDYHKLFRENYQRIQNSPAYAKNELNRLKNEFYNQENMDLEMFYNAWAFVHAYEQSGRETPNEALRFRDEDLHYEWLGKVEHN